MIKIVIPGKPLPWRAPYVGKRGCFSPRSKVMNAFGAIVRNQYNGPVIDCAVCCEIIAYMPIPLGTSKGNRLLMLQGDLHHIYRPDRTNIAKLYEDVLNGIVYRDDSLIVSGRVEKLYCEIPRVEIYVTKV